MGKAEKNARNWKCKFKLKNHYLKGALSLFCNICWNRHCTVIHGKGKVMFKNPNLVASERENCENKMKEIGERERMGKK